MKQTQEYWDKLHRQIANKYKTLPRCISSIRGLYGEGYSLQKMISRALRRKRYSTKYKDYYSELLRFLLSINDEVMVEITNEGPAPFPSNGLTMQDTTETTDRK